MVEAAHAPLAPSSAHIWAPDGGCRRSVAMMAQYPDDEESEEAREGTAAHWFVTELLSGRDVLAGALAPNGYPVNAEMVDCAQSLLIDVRDTLKAAHAPDLRIEQRVAITCVNPDNWGTPDVVIIDAPQRQVHIWDYKYGHRFVDATRNWQLLDYAMGVLESIGLDPNVAYDDPRSWRGWRISLTVAQPRNYNPVGPMREWYLSGESLRDFLPGFRKAAFEAMAPGAEFTTGEHCRDCSARRACPALQRAGAIAMDVAMLGQPVELPPHAVGLELRQIDDAIARLDARKTGLEEQALGLIRGGTLVPFFTTEHSSGQERWTIPVDQVVALGDIFDVDLRKPTTLTPNQARKAGIPAVAMDGMAIKPMGALRLKRVDDDAAKLAFS